MNKVFVPPQNSFMPPQSRYPGAGPATKSTTLVGRVALSSVQLWSGAVERVFSFAKDILKPKPAGVSDLHFEMLLVLKVNK